MLAGLFVVPAVLVFGLAMSSGPHLLFGTMPVLFSTIPGGRVFGSLMLVSLFLVAFLSVIASFQVIIVGLLEEPLGERLGRQCLLLVAGLLVSVLILIPAIHPEIIETLDLIFGSGFPIVGCCLAVIAATWRVPSEELWRQLGWSGPDTLIRGFMVFWLRWGIPAILIAVLGATVYGAFTVQIKRRNDG